jgi:hypothetical protein
MSQYITRLRIINLADGTRRIVSDTDVLPMLTLSARGVAIDCIGPEPVVCPGPLQGDRAVNKWMRNLVRSGYRINHPSVRVDGLPTVERLDAPEH